jgi:C-terminal processing protease CtpA/Prc
VQLDLAAGMIYVQPDPLFKPYPDLRRFSTIGIQFVKDLSGGISVVAVWSGSPAADAGWKIGDLVSSVNGASIST